MCDSVWPHRQQPTRLPCPWDYPGKNTGVGCHFLLQCMKVKSESEVAQSYPTLSNPMDCSLPGSSIHGIFQARVLEWGATAFSNLIPRSIFWMNEQIYLTTYFIGDYFYSTYSQRGTLEYIHIRKVIRYIDTKKKKNNQTYIRSRWKYKGR